MRQDLLWFCKSIAIVLSVSLAEPAAIADNGDGAIVFPKDDEERSNETWNRRLPLVWGSANDTLNQTSMALTSTETQQYEIPASLLMSLKDVTNISYFVDQFLENYQEPGTDDTMRVNTEYENNGKNPLAGRRQRPGPREQRVMPEAAGCETSMQLVEFEKHSDPLVILWPSCTRVERCSGCCGSPLLSCQPTKKSQIKYSVIRAKYPHPRASKFQHDGFEEITVEKHEECMCQCSVKPEDCSPLQVYKDCSCTCKNTQAFRQCSGQNKIWDAQRCQCRCINENLECSSGLFFDLNTCRCEQERRVVARKMPLRFRLYPSKLTSPYTDDREAEQSRHLYADVPMQDDRAPFSAAQFSTETKPVLIAKRPEENSTTVPT